MQLLKYRIHVNICEKIETDNSQEFYYQIYPHFKISKLDFYYSFSYSSSFFSREISWITEPPVYSDSKRNIRNNQFYYKNRQEYWNFYSPIPSGNLTFL